MSEQHDSLNRSLLMIVCKTEATGNMIADRLEELERENAALREELKIMEHRVIVCGVAATHPDPNLTLGYPKEWDSQQAEQVRSLRAENAALRLDKERLMAALRENEISAAIIAAENKRFGHVYAIERDCKFIANRAAEARIDKARKEAAP